MPRQVNGADARDQVRERPWLVHDQLIVRNDQYIYPNGPPPTPKTRQQPRSTASPPPAPAQLAATAWSSSLIPRSASVSRRATSRDEAHMSSRNSRSSARPSGRAR